MRLQVEHIHARPRGVAPWWFCRGSAWVVVAVCLAVASQGAPLVAWSVAVVFGSAVTLALLRWVPGLAALVLAPRRRTAAVPPADAEVWEAPFRDRDGMR